METRFGHFVEGQKSRNVFMVIGIVLIICAGRMTNNALSWSTGKPVHGFALIFLALVMILMLESEGKLFTGKIKGINRACNLFSCWFLHYILLLIPFGLLAALLRLDIKIRAIGTYALMVVSVLLVAVGFARAQLLKTVSYSINLKEGGQDYRIVLLSDLHLGLYVGAKHLSKAVRKINELKPDLVLIAGDIIDSDHYILSQPEKLSQIAAVLREIQSKEGVYAVLGNHDPARTDEQLLLFLEDANIHLLYNGMEELERINLAGRAGICSMKEVRIPLEEILARQNPCKPVVVLDHDPQGIREAAKMHADLVLCGHTHRGQFFPMTILAKLANGKDFFYGYRRFGMTHSIISAGTGYFRLPMRIGSDNEIVDIRLKL